MAGTRASTNTGKGGTSGKRPAPAKRSAARPRKLNSEERHRRIAEAAYFRSLARGMADDPLGDWLAAERQIDQGS